MSTSSHFSDETETVVDAQQEWKWMRNEYLRETSQRYPVKWWKRPRVLYPTLVLVVAAMIALAATAMVVGMEGMKGWRPNHGDGSEPPASGSANDEDSNVQDTGGTATTTSPTASPTSAPTVSPTKFPSASPTAQPPPRTEPLAFYVMGDGTFSSEPSDSRILRCLVFRLYFTFINPSCSHSTLRLLALATILQFRTVNGRKGFSFPK